jgi:hypothetical protein
MPEGVSYEGVFGEREEGDYALLAESVPVAPPPPAARIARRSQPRADALRAGGGVAGIAGDVSGGVPGGVVGGVVGGLPAASPPPPTTPVQHPYESTLMDAAAMRNVVERARGAGAALPDPLARGGSHHAEARRALDRARASATRKDWAAARREAQLAWVLEGTYLGSQPWAGGGTRADAVEQWRRAGDELDAAAMDRLPALRRRLDLVVRNSDLPAALEAVARAAGVGVSLLPGAVDDAAALTRAPVRVAWLDLRRATGAQALTWLVQPFGLEWAIDRGAVVVRSPRRSVGASAWTYGVGDLAAANAADFETSASRVAGAPATVRLLGIDRLLVMGDPRAHATVADFLATLRKGAGPWPDPKMLQGEAVARAARTLDESSWALLAAACHGSVDGESASRLLEAVGDRDAFAALSTRLPVLVLRTAWTVAQARVWSPGDATLRQLATAMEANVTITGAAARVGADPVAAAWAALLAELPVPARPAGLPVVRADARARLQAIARGPVRGDDAVVLSGLGRKLAGREAWNAARDDRADTAAAAKVSAGALRVLSRLERARLAGLL